MQTLDALIQQYLSGLGNRPGRPIGDDIDLVRALTGDNPLHLVYLPPDHPAISPSGHLLDRWNTPYFIHPLSSRHFEIRSAGPDRQMFTNDDFLANPASPSRRLGR